MGAHQTIKGCWVFIHGRDLSEVFTLLSTMYIMLNIRNPTQSIPINPNQSERLGLTSSGAITKDRTTRPTAMRNGRY